MEAEWEVKQGARTRNGRTYAGYVVMRTSGGEVTDMVFESRTEAREYCAELNKPSK